MDNNIIWCFSDDRTRVILKQDPEDDKHSDYINASYVDVSLTIIFSVSFLNYTDNKLYTEADDFIQSHALSSAY